MKNKWILSISSVVLGIGLLAGCSTEGDFPSSNEGMNHDIDLQAPEENDLSEAPASEADMTPVVPASDATTDQPIDEIEEAVIDENSLDEELVDQDEMADKDED